MKPDPNVADHPLHAQLVDISHPEKVNHHPLCGAHPILADGPCRCPAGQLSATIRAVIAIHYPRTGRSINSLDCDEHNPNTNQAGHLAASRQPGVFEACPDCVVTPYISCACWGCVDYPCETVVAVAGVLGYERETAC